MVSSPFRVHHDEEVGACNRGDCDRCVQVVGTKRSVTGFRAAQEAAQEAVQDAAGEPAVVESPVSKISFGASASDEPSTAQTETPASAPVDTLNWAKQIEKDMAGIEKELSSSAAGDKPKGHDIEITNQADQAAAPSEPQARPQTKRPFLKSGSGRRADNQRALPLSALLQSNSTELPSDPLPQELEVLHLLAL